MSCGPSVPTVKDCVPRMSTVHERVCVPSSPIVTCSSMAISPLSASPPCMSMMCSMRSALVAAPS